MIYMYINLTISTYLPRPLCSIDEKLTTASNIFSSWSKCLAKKLFLSWFGLMTVILGWRLWICVYSSVVTWFAPFSNNIASSHGDNEPITNTFPCFTFFINLLISFTLRRYFLNSHTNIKGKSKIDLRDSTYDYRCVELLKWLHDFHNYPAVLRF